MKKIYLLMVAMVWSLAAHAYLPLVREGAKFYYVQYIGYNEQWYVSDYQQKIRMNCYEFMGDTIIDGISYKKLFLTTTRMNTVWDYYFVEATPFKSMTLTWNQKDPILFVREENKVVYARLNKLNENRQIVLWNDFKEREIYNFNKSPNYPEHFILDSDSPVYIEGEECKLYLTRYLSSFLYFIEGIGYVNERGWDLLNEYWFAQTTDMFDTESFTGMSHVENAAGEVVYQGPLYQKYNVKQPMLGDTNDDDRIDVEDVNEAINLILRGDRIPFMRRVDLNGDGRVDVEDVNALINIILKLE